MKLKSLLLVSSSLLFISLITSPAGFAATPTINFTTNSQTSGFITNLLNQQDRFTALANNAVKNSVVHSPSLTNNGAEPFEGTISSEPEKPVADGTVTSPDGIYTITTTPGATTIAALDGNVEFTDSKGQKVKIDIGTGLVLNADGTKSTQTLASIVAAEKEAGTSGNANSVTASLGQTLNLVAQATQAGGYSGNTSIGLLAALTKVLATANPDAAATYVATATSAVTSSGSGAEDKAKAAQAILEASGQQNNAAVVAAATTAAGSNGVTVTPSTTPVTFTTPITPVDPVVVSASGGQTTQR